MDSQHAARALPAFPVADGRSWRLEPFGAGRIHETWAVRAHDADPSFLLQRVNLTVFPDYEGLMHNVDLVSRHIDSPLRFEPASDGAPYATTADGGVWRLMRFVPCSEPVPVPTSPDQAAEAAQAYGEFAVKLASLDASTVKPTIPGFHDTPKRLRALQSAAAARRPVQRDDAEDLVAWACDRERQFGFVTSRLASGEFPLRVCHNDAKADNVLIHRDSGRRLCVVDLDTVMPGSPLYDLGDLLRSAAATVGEDDPDGRRVGVRHESACSILAGFLEAAAPVLTAEERRLAPASGWLLAGEQGIRYLTDYLSGDRYYRTVYEGQNLDRARNQIALAAAFEREGWSPPD